MLRHCGSKIVNSRFSQIDVIVIPVAYGLSMTESPNCESCSLHFSNESQL